MLKEELIQLCQLTDKEMYEEAKKLLEEYYKEVKEIPDGQNLLVQGELPVCLVAHLDTVHSYPPVDFYYDSDAEVLWTPDGLGADDRAGILAIKKILEKGFRPSIIFTTEEERGGLGVERLIKRSTSCPLEDIKFFIELDRSGKDDCVFYSCENKKFQSYIEGFGFRTEKGTFTDISFIMPRWKIAGVNLSIGYYDEHSHAEHINFKDFKASLDRVIKILEDCGNAPHFNYVPQEITEGRCDCCKKPFKKGEKTFYFKAGADKRLRVCQECADYIRNA